MQSLWNCPEMRACRAVKVYYIAKWRALKMLNSRAVRILLSNLRAINLNNH